MNEQKYYFWLGGWSYWIALNPRFDACILCEVNQNGFTIYDPDTPVHVFWNQAFKIDSYCRRIRGGWSYAIEIFLTTAEAEVRRMYLIAVNPINSASLHHKQEHEALVSVINACHNHSQTTVTVHPNPYFRLFERLGKPDYFLLENWDPTISPKEYRKHPAIQNALLRYQKRGFLWAYWITTVFLAFGSSQIFLSSGKSEFDGIVVLISMWLLLTALIVGVVYSANRDLSKKGKP